ncbi:NAD(P)H-dependent oxidoreductase subunit E [Plebeiibacterium marinum]|uniref:NAD(P)H-dependent oxidoreductase subunit E n=1 Tax=Plebeiibacterium marinum TaxID=2992111 RepID=A0AAE3MFU5_9BACT|nr:NAD(P)H-dependent oxidoreductase subunit E [Plebeiobacterium marinum]MCW3807073.1 NAD(P)H-dependent oxidoreductase subunit E [Plebeiobacterium marinum]
MKTQDTKHVIRICLGSSCYTRGNAENLEIIQKFVEGRNIAASLDFRGHLCNENCNRGPVITIDGESFEEVQPFQVEKILMEKLI